jgi:exodeoxyribonuclease VII small subunit
MSKQEKSPPDADIPEDFSIEDALGRLDSIAREMESGELQLEEAMARYEEGMRLSGRCEGYLKSVKLRIEKLSEGGGAQ